MLFDIIIPLGPNELPNIHKHLLYTRQNVIGFRNIYIICCDPSVVIEGCIMVSEDSFVFKKTDVAEVFEKYHGKNNRNSWYYQQLLKLYAGFVIPDILDHYLVIDADLYFLKPTEFFVNNKMAFTVGDEYSLPYFTHMSKLHPSFTKNIDKSGISHHMLFYKKYIQEIFDIVEQYHSMPFWKAFLEMVEEHKNYPVTTLESGASEYEIYFNYVIKKYPDDVHIRILSWKNECWFYDLNENSHYDFLALCSWKSW